MIVSAHSPGDLCACYSGSTDRCEYRLVADLVNDRLNPPDHDYAEAAVVMEAIERIAVFVESLPCTCVADDEGEPCARCAALGRQHDVPSQR